MPAGFPPSEDAGDASGPARTGLVAEPASVSALDVDGLRKSYDGRTVVDGLSMHAPAGAITAVLGPNGAGKTTTIECCAGLRSPDAGRITVLGLDRLRPASAPDLRRRVGVMLQEGGLPMSSRTATLLGHVARLHDRPKAATPLLDRLGLGAVKRTRVRHLSGGQRQRLALACAIVGEPELVFLDEPTAGLDPQARLAVWELLRQLRQTGASMVLTTHTMAEAEELADHVVIVDSGQVVATGSPAALRGAPYIRITPAPGATAPAVAGELSRALGDRVGGASVEASIDGRDVLVRGETALDAGTLAEVASALAAGGHAAAQLALVRPTLEDTFLALTGRELRTDAS